MKRALILIAVLASMASCKKEKIIHDLPGRNTLLATARYYFNYNAGADYYTEEFTYSPVQQVTKMESRLQGASMLASRTYHYTNGRLTSVDLNAANGVKIAEHRYVYATGKNLQKFQYLEYVNNNTELRLMIEHDFEYNAQGQPVKTTVKNYNTGTSYYIVSTYTNHNVAKQTTYTLPGNTLKDETVYEYDNKRNPYYKQEIAGTGNPKYYSVNNILKMTIKTAATGAVNEIGYYYEYNNDAYPVKQYNMLGTNKMLHATFEYL